MRTALSTVLATVAFILLTSVTITTAGLVMGLGWLAEGAELTGSIGRALRVALSVLAVTIPAGILWALLSWLLDRAKAKRPHVDFFVAAFAAPAFLFALPGVDAGRLPNDTPLLLVFIAAFVAAAFVFWVIAERAA